MICPVCNAEFDGDACPACGAAVTSPTSALIAAASQLLKEGLPDQAIESLDQAVSRDPRSYEAHSLLGAAYLRKQEYQLAGHHFERAVWLDSGRAAARYNLAVAYRTAGRADDAVQQLRAALDKDPHHEKSRALLRELEKAAANGVAGIAPGSPENRPRAAAPHLAAVHVPGARLSHRAQIGFGALSAFVAIILGAVAYRLIFGLLTSPQLDGRDAVLWGQLPYAFGVILFVAGVVAASFQAKGAPVAGLVAGSIGVPVGVAIVLAFEREPITAKIVFGALVCGGLFAAAVETFAKYTRVGEFRRVLLWASLALVAAYVVCAFVRQGSVRGYVTVGAIDGIGQPITVRVPDAEIVLQDPRTRRLYSTFSVNAEKSGRPASAQGSYHLSGMPVGRYNLICVQRSTGASWQGEVFVDYDIVQGNEFEIQLTLPTDEAAKMHEEMRKQQR
jgi:hypothetical protein